VAKKASEDQKEAEKDAANRKAKIKYRAGLFDVLAAH
jgi:hypothetical protein